MLFTLSIPFPDLNFSFHTSLWCFKRFYEGLWGLHKTFWRTTKKCENKNVSKFLFYYSFLKCTGLEWFTISYLLYIICEKWKLYKKEFSWSIKKVLETPRKAGKQFNTSSIILSKQWYHNIVLKIRCCSSHSQILLKTAFLKNFSIPLKTPVLESFFYRTPPVVVSADLNADHFIHFLNPRRWCVLWNLPVSVYLF